LIKGFNNSNSGFNGFVAFIREKLKMENSGFILVYTKLFRIFAF